MMTFSVSILFIFFTHIASVFSQVMLDPLPLDHLPLSECTLLVMRRFISTKSKSLMVMENCRDCLPLMRNFNLRLLNHLLYNFEARMTIQLYVAAPDEQPWNYNIFIVNNVLAFKELRFNFAKTIHEREFFFLIILTENMLTKGQRLIMLNRIFTICVQFNVIHAVIMLEHLDGSIIFYSYKIFESNCRRRLSISVVNRFRAGKFEQKYIFPPRLRNFHSCELTISGYLLPPLLSFIGDHREPDQLRDMWRLSGIEGDLLKLLADALNFRMILKLHKEKSILTTYRNWTGIFRELHRGTADIAIGGLSNSDPRSIVFTPSTTYHHNSLVFVVCSGLHFGPLKQLANSFRATVWLLIGLMLFIALRVIKALRDQDNAMLREFILGTRNINPRSNLWTIFLGNPIKRLPRRNFARFLLMSWMLVTFVLRSAYQGKMYDVLRVSQRVPIPRDLNELIDKNYYLLTSTLYDFYPVNRTILLSVNFSERFALLEQYRGKYVGLALLDNLAHHNRLNHETSTLTYVKEPIYMYQQVMYFQKHSILKPAFDHKIKQLTSAGITSYIAKKHVKRKFLKLNVDKQLVSQISNNMLRGLYVIYGVMMGVAVVCFMLEWMTQRTQRLRRLRSWLQAAHSIE